jgi:hypothetical protein
MQPSYSPGKKVRLRVVAFDITESVVVHRVPIARKSKIYTAAFYRIRDAFTKDVIVPFESSKNATLMSTDSDGMYFDIFTDDFPIGRSLVVDVLLKDSSIDRVFESIGGTFRIDP